MIGLTVGELRKVLEGRDDSLPVVIDAQNSEYDYTSAMQANIGAVEWGTDVDGEELEEPEQRSCFIITSYRR